MSRRIICTILALMLAFSCACTKTSTSKESRSKKKPKHTTTSASDTNVPDTLSDPVATSNYLDELYPDTDEIYEKFEGYYECPDDPEVYLNIYTDENGTSKLEMTLRTSDGTILRGEMTIDYAFWQGDSFVVGRILNPSEGNVFEYKFEYAEDMSTLTHAGTEYVRKST